MRGLLRGQVSLGSILMALVSDKQAGCWEFLSLSGFGESCVLLFVSLNEDCCALLAPLSYVNS